MCGNNNNNNNNIEHAKFWRLAMLPTIIIIFYSDVTQMLEGMKQTV